jgi:hypothetical protein
MESFTRKGLIVTAAAALIAMACVVSLMTTMPPLVEKDGTPLEASPDLPTFQPVR